MLTPTPDTHAEASDNRAIALRAWAKVNLSLVVFERRADGYHELHTVMVALDFHDDLHISVAESPGIRLYCSGLACPKGPENLTWQAARLLAERCGIDPALDIHLHKRIALSAGLGGGSSDAATCLMGLDRLWNLQMKPDQLVELAAELGSDVPFFLHCPVAVCTGRGEVVTAVPHRCRRGVLLITPKIKVSTAQVYENYRCDERANRAHMRRVRYFLRLGDLDGLVTQGINTLTPTCMGLCDELRRLHERIEEMGIGPVYLSGSGSCMFATSPSRKQLDRWAQQLGRLDIGQVRVVGFHDHAKPFVEVHRADI